MRRLPLPLVLLAAPGCLSLTAVRTEAPAPGADGALRFEAATVVVYTGAGDAAREVAAVGVVVRPDSAFWRDAARVRRAEGFDVRRMRRGRPSDVPVEAVPTRWVREVVTRRRAPQVGRGVLNGLGIGLATGGPILAYGVVSDATTDGWNLGTAVGLMAMTGATALGLTFGLLDGLQAREHVRHVLHGTPPP